MDTVSGIIVESLSFQEFNKKYKQRFWSVFTYDYPIELCIKDFKSKFGRPPDIVVKTPIGIYTGPLTEQELRPCLITYQ